MFKCHGIVSAGPLMWAMYFRDNIICSIWHCIWCAEAVWKVMVQNVVKENK